jgi:hypothetical protein
MRLYRQGPGGVNVVEILWKQTALGRCSNVGWTSRQS